MVKRIALGCGALLALVLIIAGWLLHDILGPGPSAPVVSPAVTSSPAGSGSSPPTGSGATVPTTPPKVVPVQDNPQDPSHYVLRVTENDANEVLRTNNEVRVALEQAKVSDVRLRFEPDLLSVEARLPVWGKLKARISASGRVWAQDGAVAYETKSVKAGSLPAPSAVREELDRQIGDALNRLNRENKGQLESVQIRDGAMEIRGRKSR